MARGFSDRTGGLPPVDIRKEKASFEEGVASGRITLSGGRASFGGDRTSTIGFSSSADIRSAYFKSGITSITDPRTGYVAQKGTARYREIYRRMEGDMTAATKARADLQQPSQLGDLAIGVGGGYRTPPSTDTRTPQEKFVASTTRVEQISKRGMDLKTRGEDLFVGEDSVRARHEEAMQTASLTGKPTFKEEKEYRDKVEAYIKDRDKYLATVPEAKIRGMTAGMQASDLAYATGVDVPPAPYKYTSPTPTPGASYARTGSIPSHFVTLPKDFTFAKEVFETKFPKPPITPKNELQRARENIGLVGKGVGEAVEGIGKITPTDILGPTIEDYPTFLTEKSADIKKTAGEGYGLYTDIRTVPTKLKRTPGIPLALDIGMQLYKTGKPLQTKRAIGTLKFAEVGSKAAGLGFVAIGEPVIGSLPDYELDLPMGYSLTKGKFRRALDISGQIAFYDAALTLPKAIPATKALITGGKIPTGLRLDEPIRYVLGPKTPGKVQPFKTGYLGEITKAPLDVRGKGAIVSVGDDTIGKVSVTARDFPQETFKFKLAKALGFTDEGTKITQQYTGVFTKGGKDVPSDVVFTYKAKRAGGFSLDTRKIGVGEKFTGSFYDEKLGFGKAFGFEDVKKTFPKKAVMDIEEYYKGGRFVTTTIDDVPTNLMQIGKPIGGKTKVSTIRFKTALADDVIEKTALHQKIEMVGETFGTPIKKSSLRKMAEKLKIVPVKQTKEIVQFKTKDLGIRAISSYYDESLVKPGGILGRGKGPVKGLFEIEGKRGVKLKMDLVFADVKPFKTGKGMVDDLTKGLIEQAGGKQRLIAQATLDSGTQTISTSAVKTKTIARMMQTLGVSLTTTTTKTVPKTFTRTAGMAALGLTKTITRTTPKTTITAGRQQMVTLTRPTLPKLKPLTGLAKVGTFGITRRMMGTPTKTKALTKITPVTKLKTDLIYAQPTKLKEVSKFRSPLDTAMKLTPISITRPTTKLRTDIAIATKIIPITRTIQRQRMDYKFTMPPIDIPIIPPPTKTPPLGWFPKIKMPKPTSMLKMQKQMGFRLEIKRKGQWMPAFKGVFTEKSAKGLAQQLVGGTPLASFRISKAYGIPKMVTGLPAFKPEQFRRPIRKGKFVPSEIFVEKTKFRIDTPGELKGITYKGLETLALMPKKRRKKKKKKKRK